MQTKTQEITRRRFTVHDYHRMAEARTLHEDDRVELVEGEILDMTPIGAHYASVVRKLNRVLGQHVGDEFLVHTEPSGDGYRYVERARRGEGELLDSTRSVRRRRRCSRLKVRRYRAGDY